MQWFDSILIELLVSGFLIILIGLPHGATDLLLFRYLTGKEDVRSYTKFLSIYLGLIATYAIFWIYLPQYALLGFIVISIYHFGQSNWAFLKSGSVFQKLLMYVLSGCFVMLTPLCINYGLTMEVVEGITGISSLSIDYGIIASLPRTLMILNIWALFYIFSKSLISKQELYLQIIGLVLLMLAFSVLPLILSFTVYFVFWHSYGSMIDQIEFIRTKSKKFSWFSYFKNAIPITIVAIVFIGLCVGVNSYFDLGFSFIQVFFIILSLFTLPHIILIEQIYSTNENPILKGLQLTS